MELMWTDQLRAALSTKGVCVRWHQDQHTSSQNLSFPGLVYTIMLLRYGWIYNSVDNATVTINTTRVGKKSIRVELKDSNATALKTFFF